MIDTVEERCPMCRRVKKLCQCVVLAATTLIGGGDDHVHDHRENRVPTTKAVAIVSSTASDTGSTLDPLFVIKDRPPSG